MEEKKDGKYFFTEHAKMKMRHYGLSPQRVTRVIKSPERVEEGVVEKTVACMQPQSIKRVDGKKVWKSEIWVMYQIKDGIRSQELGIMEEKIRALMKGNISPAMLLNSANRQIRVISAWRYPGVSPKNDPIPEDILREISGAVL